MQPVDRECIEDRELTSHPFPDGFAESIDELRRRLRMGASFDLIERRLRVAGHEVALFFVDGFVKDGEMQRIMQYLLGLTELSDARALSAVLPYVEVDEVGDIAVAVRAVLSGQSLIVCDSFRACGLLVDARTYPARSTSEPDGDRVMQGAHDGFVETLVVNTALIRRRIRDPRLTMRHFNLGGATATDVVLCYMDGVADGKAVSELCERLLRLRPDSLTLGYQSLAESLIRRGWYNPFPKLRLTERPDTAASQLLEGSILILCDTTPQAMILPTSVFAYLEQADDFYFPPLTGSYLRIVRTLILLLSAFVTPLWYLALQNASLLPPSLAFLVPDEPGSLPIIVQLLIVELAIDGLKIASMNTPDMLSNSLSVVGALLLGDFAVETGWLCGDVILYMAFVAIAGFAQQNAELGYAFKFVRVLTLLLVFALGGWGLLLGAVLTVVLLATNTTAAHSRGYLYPLVPLDPRALGRLLVRRRKPQGDGEKD